MKPARRGVRRGIFGGGGGGGGCCGMRNCIAHAENFLVRYTVTRNCPPRARLRGKTGGNAPPASVASRNLCRF